MKLVDGSPYITERELNSENRFSCKARRRGRKITSVANNY